MKFLLIYFSYLQTSRGLVAQPFQEPLLRPDDVTSNPLPKTVGLNLNLKKSFKIIIKNLR